VSACQALGLATPLKFISWTPHIARSISSNLCRCGHTYGGEVIMSFGFSVGDFLTVFEQANKLRKRFVNAPAQFDALSEQYSHTIFYETPS
jgi:hypothetical protein